MSTFKVYDADGNEVFLEGDGLGTSSGAPLRPLQVSRQETYGTIATGEVAGATSATVMPTVACKMVKFKAASDNTGKVALGGSGVTLPNGTTDTTTGWVLSAGEETGWWPISNVNILYRICTAATDDVFYIALS